jgi:hypothetical protein
MQTFTYPNEITRGMQASAARRKSLAQLHPESYHQLRELVKLHGLIVLRRTLDEIEAEQ